MKNILIIKDADFSAYAVERVSFVDGPIILFSVEGLVTITFSGGDVYYTTDGSEPTESSTKYTQPFTVTAQTVVKAVGVVGGVPTSISTGIYNAGGQSILSRLNESIGFSSSSSATLTYISINGYGVSPYIPVPQGSDLNINYGATIQDMGMWTEYYKFKIVECDSNKTVLVSTEAKQNDFGSSIPVGNQCIWSIREGSENLNYKNIPTQSQTEYIRIVVKLDTAASVVDKDNNNNVLFQYIPD